MSASPRAALVILAAGASTRMGRAKQLLLLDGLPLVQRILQSGRKAGFDPLFVVTGARRQEVEAALREEKVQLVHNPAWESGMGSSVAAGLDAALQRFPELGAIGFALTDQPYVDEQLLQQMKQRLLQSDAPGIAAQYEGTLGAPAIFRRALFADLQQLRGAKGAKPLLLKHQRRLLAHPCPAAAIDLDWPADWQAFLQKRAAARAEEE